jgi:hypothetical protein
VPLTTVKNYRIIVYHFNLLCGRHFQLFMPFVLVHSITIAPTSSSKSKLPIVPKIDTTIRAKRLMKEFRELQKSQNDRNEKIFSVNLLMKIFPEFA